MKSAPELFRGDHSQIRTFLDHYECLCALHNVVDDQEKVDSILHYCSTRVQEIIKGMTHFHVPNWDELKNDLLKHFDADLSDERFYEKDLKNFVTSARRAPILSLHDFRAYNRDFICIGGWLRNKGKITEEDYNRHFWAGLPPSFHLNVDSCLILKDPDLDVSIPYSYSDVCKAAEELLRRDRFDAKSVIKMSIDTSHSMVMRDANGGTSKLIGLIQNVPLFCGAAQTWTNLFVSPNNDSGFDLLLGRPWAHGNSVSIVERDSGTYIIFGADSNHPLEMCAVDVHAASHTGTGLMATLEPESEMEEESTAPYSSPLDPATLDVLSDQFLDFPEAPDPSPDDPNPSLSVDQSSAMPMIPALQVSAASSAHLSPPGLPDRITSPPPFIPKPLSFHPIPSLTHAPPSTPASTPPDPSPTSDDALQSIIEEIEFSGGTATVAKENPLIAHICAKIHEQEHCSFLDLLLLSASRIVDHLGLYLETCYALPAQEGVDTLGNRYQDYLILRTSLTLSCAETTAIPAGHATYRGCAFTRFYPHPCTPVAKTLGSPVPATIEDPDPPPSCPNPYRSLLT